MIDLPGFTNRDGRFNKKEERKMLKINDNYLPIGVAETGELVLLPRTDIACNIGLYGEKQRGKCSKENELIFAEVDGVFKVWKVKDLFTAFNMGAIINVFTLNEETFKMERKQIRCIALNGIKPILEVSFKDRGIKKINTTHHHRYLLLNEKNNIYYKEAKNLIIGEEIPCANKKEEGSGISWKKIINIEKKPKAMTYSIEVQDNANYMLANKAIIHNTLTMWALMDRIYHNWGHRVFFANEFLDIAFDHRYPEISTDFVENLKHLNQKPVGLPLAFCYPSTESVRLKGHIPEIKMSIPFREFIMNPYDYAKLSPKDKSLKYFNQLRDKLLVATSNEELREALNDLPDTVKKNSGPKLRAIFDDLIQQKTFDMENPDTVSSVEAMTKYGEHAEMDPIVALLLRNYVPVLMTENLLTKKYASTVFEYYMDQIYREKQEGGALYDFPIYAMVDELNKFVGKKELEVVTKWVTEGGNLGIGGLGLFWTAQNYTKIPLRITDNTQIGFCFDQHETGAARIATDFSLTLNQKKKLKKLKMFEFMALTKDEWALLDPLTGNITKTTEPLKVKALPGMSRHRSHIFRIEAKRRGIKIKPDKPFEAQYKSQILINGKEFLMPYQLKKKVNVPAVLEHTNLRKEFWGEEKSHIITIDMGELERKGFGVLQVKLDSKFQYFANQTTWFFLYNLERTVPPEAMPLSELPNTLKIQLDIANKRIRLWGRGSGAKDLGQWELL